MSDAKTLSTREYVKAVARALDMPEMGINSLSISADFGSPVIVHIQYVLKGTPALLDFLSPCESVKMEITAGNPNAPMQEE